MNYCAIIAEFNPLTNGHKYIINKAKELTGLDIICLMSGNFVQRGEPAILNKYERATAAINNGASIVLELPLVYAISSAEVFASGAIKILSGIKNISHLAFGVETTNTNLLEKLAKIKVDHNLEIKEFIKKEVKNGVNHNKATILALKKFCNEESNKIEEIFNGANNILALEYLTALYKEKSPIIPIFINRIDNGYNSKKIATIKLNNNKTYFASASTIRSLTEQKSFKQLKKVVPQETFISLIKLNENYLNEMSIKTNTIVLNELRKHDINSLSTHHDYSQSLSGLIHKLSLEQTSINNIINMASGKSFRPARIRKLLLYPLLNLTKENFEQIYNSTQNITVLVAAKNKKQDLSKIKNQSKTNIIISVKDYNNCENKKSLELNQLSSDIYSLISSNPISKDKSLFI